MDSRMKILLGFASGLLALTGWSQQAFACSCAPPGSPSEELERSTAVFSGRVVGMEVPSGRIVSSADPVAVTFEVYTVWEGPRSDRVTVTTARWSLSCGYPFEAGKEYLVYARGEADDLQVSLCSHTKPLGLAAGDLDALGNGHGTGLWTELRSYEYLMIAAGLVLALGLGLGLRTGLSRRGRT